MFETSNYSFIFKEMIEPIFSRAFDWNYNIFFVKSFFFFVKVIFIGTASTETENGLINLAKLQLLTEMALAG